MTTAGELDELLGRLSPEPRRILVETARRLVTGASGLSDLMAVIQEADEAQIGQLISIARAMTRPIDEWINPASEVAGPKFVAEFRARLQAHHGTHVTPLDRLGFEAALAAASRAEGRTVELAPSATTRFWDLRIDGAQVSAKSTSAKGLRREELHISKLSEAAWIQDMRSAKIRHDMTIQLFTDFLAAVQQWFVLRAFVRSTGWLYELVEIPMGIFAAVLDLPVRDFASDAPRIPLFEGGTEVARLHLDRSDAKITISKIKKSARIVHATWLMTN